MTSNKDEQQHRITTIEITDIVQDDQLQVRAKLDAGFIDRYANAYKQDVEMPPVTVAEINGAFILVDGWHRIAALQSLQKDCVEVRIIPSTMREAHWLAAQANLTHGLALKTRELQEVFKKYVKAHKHFVSMGTSGKRHTLKSYREIATDLGGYRAHTTIRNWMKKYFPNVYRRMSDDPIPSKGQGGLIDEDFKPISATVRDNINNVRAAYRGVTDPDEKAQLIGEVEKLLEQMWADEVPQPQEYDLSSVDF